MARGDVPPEVGRRRLIAVFVTPVTEFLLHFAKDLGFETIMMDPDSGRLHWAEWRYADQVATVPTVDFVDRDTDVILTDHDRDELGPTLESFLRLPARWIGVVGSPGHYAPHVDALRRLGVPDQVIARVRRPVGLNVGAKTPAEIALSALAGLIADRNRRPGGFAF
jgi:xanthine/CO dehydrogenase XdhC/CoxF family maturation factor